MAEGTRAAGALQTREALLDAGAALAEEHGLAGVSVNMVVARAGVAKGTFYVHFKDRAAFVDAMHARFHARVEAAVAEAIAGLPPGDYSISVSYIGFQKLTKTVTVNPGTSTTVSLSPSTVVVNQASTTTTVMSSPSPSVPARTCLAARGGCTR